MANVVFPRIRVLGRLMSQRTSVVLKDTRQERYLKCTDCLIDHREAELKAVHYLCPRCGCHLRMPARARLELVLDPGTLRERFSRVVSNNPLSFPEYEEKVAEAARRTGLTEACLAATGRIGGREVVCAALDGAFLMGSMGAAVGEKVTRCVELAGAKKLPLVIFSASGGARMQEGMFSLMQMAKTAAALRQFSDGGGLYLSCITHPTTGGVTASFASLGDLTLAEPGALFGFAGPRVIEQTTGETLPPGFQRSEFQQEHGFVDEVVHRLELRQTLAQLLALHGR